MEYTTLLRTSQLASCLRETEICAHDSGSPGLGRVRRAPPEGGIVATDPPPHRTHCTRTWRPRRARTRAWVWPLARSTRATTRGWAWRSRTSPPPRATRSRGSSGLGRGHGMRSADVSIGFDESPPVLRAVSLDLLPTTRLLVLGHNGAGKSCLLRAAAGGVTRDDHSSVTQPSEAERTFLIYL